jgi:DNA-binding IclR family transcriptional regulator
MGIASSAMLCQNLYREGTGLPRTGQPAVRHVAAVERALAVLDAFAGGEELGTNELARRTGINASTVSRLLATLAAGGLVEHVPASGRYRLGVRLLQLGNAVLAGLDLRAIARPHLQQLVAETGETATLSVPGEPDAVTVDFVQSRASVQSVAALGRPSVAHATAAGKVLLAFGGRPLPSGALRRYTARTITSRARLTRALAEVRATGLAQAVGEREDHLNAIAAPVWSARGDLAVILGIQGPAARFDLSAMQAAGEPLIKRAQAISAAIGRGPPR